MKNKLMHIIKQTNIIVQFNNNNNSTLNTEYIIQEHTSSTVRYCTVVVYNFETYRSKVNEIWAWKLEK
jgi:hypothetical protein